MGLDGSIEEFSVKFHRKQDTGSLLCLPGDVLYGTVYLTTVQHLALSSITITVRGHGFVHWTNQRMRGPGDPRFKDTHHHSSTENYLDQKLVLYGDAKGDQLERCYLQAGRYTYPFRCELPTRLPCSYEGEHGYVRYWVKATIEKGRNILHKTIVPFCVLSPLDLNAVPESNKPVQESTEKNICCLCCTSGPISATLCLPKRGYVPGEPIRFGAEISNLSSRKLGCCSVELKMTSVYKTDTEQRSTTEQICKVRREQKVGRGEDVMWYCDQLVVPPIPPSCLIGCNIISIKYTLELRIEPIGLAFDLTLPIEVIIGTVPHKVPRPIQLYENVQGSSRHGDPSSVRYRHLIANTSRADHRHPSSTGSQSSGSHVGSISQNSYHPLPQHEPNQGHIGHVYQVPYQQGPSRQTQSPPNDHREAAPALSDRASEVDSGRPPSRASSAPSSTSGASLTTPRCMSVIFLESSTRRRKVPYSNDSDKYCDNIRYAPVYPFYQWK